jgi:L-ascorbate metabolism protein UlaG (beta-lactamase superfamily)
MIEINGKKILTDPFISNNPKATLEPIELKPDIILLTHDHDDHFGDTIDITKNSGAQVITIFDLAQELKKYQIDTIGGNIGGTVNVLGIDFTFTKADHSSNKGVPVGFIIRSNTESLYFAGDTNVFFDMKIIKDLYSPDIAMLPIDGYFNMGPKEAVYALTLLDVKKVIPMHYGTFPLLKGTPEQLKKEMDSKKLKIEMIEFNINQEKEV